MTCKMPKPLNNIPSVSYIFLIYIYVGISKVEGKPFIRCATSGNVTLSILEIYELLN